jgi:hypothetical protein
MHKPKGIKALLPSGDRDDSLAVAPGKAWWKRVSETA